MNSISAIRPLPLAIGLLVVATSDAEEAVSVDPTMLNRATEANPPEHVTSRSSESQWSSEQCSVSHQGRYRNGRYRRTRVYYYDFDVSVTSNCKYARLLCLVRYRTLVYEPYHAGRRSAADRAPWWESSLQTLMLKPGETTETSPLGPTRRNAGGYEIECTTEVA